MKRSLFTIFAIIAAGIGLSMSGSLSALGGPALATPAPMSPSATPAPSVAPRTVSPSPTATPIPSPSPIIPPRDAPAVRKTTPPFSASRNGPVGPPAPDSIWLGASTSIGVPMTLHGGRPYIDVILNGHPATFLVDTASLTTLIDASALEERGPGPRLSLQIAELRFPRLGSQPADVRSFTETNLGVAADGIIGADLLARYPVEFDFPNRTLTIYRDSRSAAAAEPRTASTGPMRVIDGRPAAQAALDGESGLWFSLATGGGFELQLEPHADRGGRLGRQMSLPYENVSQSGNQIGRLARARALTMGGVTFYQPLIAIVNAQPPASELSGALGADMLSKLNFFIDESSSNLAFVVPPGATLAALYEPSGMSLVVRRGAIVVRSTVPGSAADAAHLRPGDQILSVNGLAPATLDFTRELLNGSPGSKVVIVYRRSRLTRSATLTLRVLI